jgi:hypothetical protein
VRACRLHSLSQWKRWSVCDHPDRSGGRTARPIRHRAVPCLVHNRPQSRSHRGCRRPTKTTFAPRVVRQDEKAVSSRKAFKRRVITTLKDLKSQHTVKATAHAILRVASVTALILSMVAALSRSSSRHVARGARLRSNVSVPSGRSIHARPPSNGHFVASSCHRSNQPVSRFIESGAPANPSGFFWSGNAPT